MERAYRVEVGWVEAAPEKFGRVPRAKIFLLPFTEGFDDGYPGCLGIRMPPESEKETWFFATREDADVFKAHVESHCAGHPHDFEDANHNVWKPYVTIEDVDRAEAQGA